MSGLHAKLENFAADQAHKRFPEEGSDANRYGFIEGYIAATKSGTTLQTFLRPSGTERQIAALTSRAEAAEVQVAACRGYVQDWDDSKKAAVDVIAKIRAVTASSLPASPDTEKLQARVKELEGALRPFANTHAMAESNEDGDSDDCYWLSTEEIRIGDLRRAASALKGEG